MPPYSTRKRTSSNSQESQIKTKTSSTKASLQTRSITNELSRVKDRAKVSSTQLITRSKKALINKQRDASVILDKDISQEEEQKATRRKRLRKDASKIKSVQSEKVAVHNKTTKQVVKNPKRKNISSRVNESVSKLRQTSLKESFTKQTRIIGLRSRNVVKNSKKENASGNDHLSHKLRNSTVVLNRLSTEKRKVPVYKCVSPENSPKSKSEIYEFKFDIDDSKERLPKKRKKRRIVKKTIVPKRRKDILENKNVQKTEVHEKGPVDDESEKRKEENPSEPLQIHQKEPVAIESKETKDSLPESLKNNILVESSVKSQVQKNLMENVEGKVDSNKEELSVQSALEAPEIANKEETADSTIAKPTIISVEDLSNARITVMDNLEASNSEDPKSLKSANAANNKPTIEVKNMRNHSLFEKTVSPIVKSSENINLNSPWRTPQLFTFSQVRNVFQSTPQSKQFEISGKRLYRNHRNISKLKDTLQNNENISIEGHGNASNFKKKNPTISRKFGTEITNLEHSMQSNLIEDSENLPPSRQSVSTPNTTNVSKFDNTENKQNSVANYESPKKDTRKELKTVKTISPLKSMINMRSNEEKENLDPQPGPSGLQNNKVFNEQRVLRQSNLNNFLNIMDTPQSTTINTPHGIFADVHSTPVSGKSGMKPEKSDMELKNAFGFDDDSNQDISSIEHEVANDTKENEKVIQTNVSPIEHEVANDSKENEKAIQTDIQLPPLKPFTRISLGELRNNLLPTKSIENIKNVKNVENLENVDNKKTKVKKSPIKPKRNHVVDITNFSDTFDVLSEVDESGAESTSNVPLFADLEPSHFTQPPRHSYKRKRAVKFSLSEESSEEEEEVHEHAVKRKKSNKMKKEQEGRLLKWVEDINKTFDEIDKYELMVE